jgi:hypothetical protein
VDDLAAALLRLLKRREHARVVRPRILADDEDGLGESEVFERDGALTDADGLGQAAARRLVAHVRAVGQVVGAELTHEELIQEGRLVRRAPRRVEGRLVW